MLCIQESKLPKLDSKLSGEIWGDREVEWREVEAINSVGGVLIL